MTQLDDNIEQRLLRLKASTEAIVPRARFVEDVCILLAQHPSNDLSSVVWRWGKIGVALGVVVAAAGVMLALGQSSVIEREEALAYGTMEYFE